MQKLKPRKKTLLLISLGHAVNDICWLMVPLLLPLIREELGFSYTYAGLIVTCFSAVILAFSLVSGHLADIYEERKVLSFGFFLTVATIPLLLFTRTYLHVIAVLCLVAIGVSVFHPVGIASLSRSWKRGISFGLFEATGGTGILIMTILFTPLVSTLGWRLTALVLVLPNLPLGLAFLLSKQKIKYETPSSSVKENSANSSNLSNSSGSSRNSSQESVELKSLILFYIGRGFQIFGIVAIVSFIPLFGVDVRGLPAEKASLFPIFLWIGAVAGGIGAGALSDYFSPLKIILTLVILIIPAIFIITLPVHFMIIVIFLMMIGFAYIGPWPVQNMWLSRVTSEKVRGKIFGGMISLVGLAQILSPLLFGFVADKWGLITSFRFTILPVAVAVVCLGTVLAQVKRAESRV